ncbi:MAG TPA: tetratricopeptide repeat protein, partial [Tepidisphaeraceae bacterium]|nr:tetratricopeptide repeat protein [Tepidisphaeraceae bacterium]
EAAESVRSAIEAAPNVATFHTNLGLILAARGELDAAIAAHRQSIALRPEYPEAFNNLGCAQQAQGSLDEAVAAFGKALALRWQYPEAHNNLANALKNSGRLDDAIAHYRQAIALRPNFPEALNNFGRTLQLKGDSNEAAASFRKAVSLRPDYAEAHYNLAVALQHLGQFADAVAAHQRAIQLRPDHAVTYNGLGSALLDLRRVDDAIEALRKALSLQPEFPEALNNLGNALKAKGELDDAIAAFRQALARRPEFPEALNNLGTALTDVGLLSEAIECQRRSLELRPNAAIGSNLLYTLLFQPGLDRKTVFEEHLRWNQTYAEPLASLIRPHENDRTPDRRLRIGYVSPDFRNHAVGYNVIGLIRNHDRSQFQVVCYSNVATPDALTGTFRAHADAWREIRALSDQQAAEQIRKDRIDILVDLSLHTADNRLLVFAQKPAPVQVSFAGYPGTTGMKAIDYRLTDPYLDPPGEDQFSSETPVRLSDCFWCYDPIVDEPSVNELPARTAGFVTFGCLCKFAKVNPAVLSLWARVLAAVPSSRLMMSAPKGSARQHTIEFLSAHGVEPGRVEFVGHQPREDYLRTFQRIDVGLDTFPYNGHTTSLDSFWMGVPVVTLVGNSTVSRAGWCQLCNLDLKDLAAGDEEQFVQIAAALSRDLDRLGELRRTLRDRMRRSPLMDAARYAQYVEREYRSMWRRWCESR